MLVAGRLYCGIFAFIIDHVPFPRREAENSILHMYRKALFLASGIIRPWRKAATGDKRGVAQGSAKVLSGALSPCPLSFPSQEAGDSPHSHAGLYGGLTGAPLFVCWDGGWWGS